MASYTNINGVKLISTGDEAGTWGTSTNTNLEILDAASKGFKKITMTDADYTLPLDNNPSAVENGHYSGIEFFGANSAERTITLEQNDHALVYLFLNNSGDVLRIKQGDGTGGGDANAGTVTIADGDSAIVFADGAGTNAKIVDITAVMQVEAATKLSTSRDFSITGDITAAAVSFDGTGAVALSADITSDTIVNADIKSDAAIADTKLDTISTASKVSNSATTATDANTASAIVARDASGNFSAGTITANLTGDVTGNADTATSATSATTAGTVSDAAQPNITSVGTLTTLTVDDITIDGSTISDSGDFTLDVGGDITLDADGSTILMKDGGSSRFTFNLDTAPSIDVYGAFEIDCNNDITLDVDGGEIFLKDAGVAAGKLDVSTANQVSIYGGTDEGLRVASANVNVLGGLRVGDGTAPTDNDIYAAADIEAANNLTAGNEIVMTSGTQDWTFEVDASNNLIVQYNGTSLMKLDSSGNLTVAGNVTAFGSL